MTSQEWWILNRVPVETDHQSDGEPSPPAHHDRITVLQQGAVVGGIMHPRSTLALER